MTENFFTTDIGYEPKLNFADEQGNLLPSVTIDIKNGEPVLINTIEAIRQWIIKFCMTDKDKYPIYEGTGFGCRIRELYGRKRVGYGYEESELERDFKEGLPLCPAINQVTSVEIKKDNTTFDITLEVELYDGTLLDVSIDKIYTVGGSDILTR